MAETNHQLAQSRIASELSAKIIAGTLALLGIGVTAAVVGSPEGVEILSHLTNSHAFDKGFGYGFGRRWNPGSIFDYIETLRYWGVLY